MVGAASPSHGLLPALSQCMTAQRQLSLLAFMHLHACKSPLHSTRTCGHAGIPLLSRESVARIVLWQRLRGSPKCSVAAAPALRASEENGSIVPVCAHHVLPAFRSGCASVIPWSDRRACVQVHLSECPHAWWRQSSRECRACVQLFTLTCSDLFARGVNVLAYEDMQSRAQTTRMLV